MPSFDRRGIVPLLQNHYPQILDMTSEQIEAFLNSETGASVTREEPNGMAFDTWRRILVKKLNDKKIWPYTEVDERTFRERSDQMKRDEEERQARLRDQ